MQEIQLSGLIASTQHKPSFKEIRYRASDPRWVASHLYRQFLRAYDLISPSDFSFKYRQVKDITMVGNARLRGLYRAVRHVEVNRIPGDLVECGVARGGSSALLSLTAPHRKLWCLDSFEGLPAPSENDPDYEYAQNWTGKCKGSIEDVQSSFRRLGVGNVELVKGLFQDTVPYVPIEQIAVLHLDGDWYDSTKVCLEHLYDRVVPGGVIQLDDYGFWKGSAKAVDEFFMRRGIKPRLTKVDYYGRQLVKE